LHEALAWLRYTVLQSHPHYGDFMPKLQRQTSPITTFDIILGIAVVIAGFLVLYVMARVAL
jgi:hypothetical protein